MEPALATTARRRGHADDLLRVRGGRPDIESVHEAARQRPRQHRIAAVLGPPDQFAGESGVARCRACGRETRTQSGAGRTVLERRARSEHTGTDRARRGRTRPHERGAAHSEPAVDGVLAATGKAVRRRHEIEGGAGHATQGIRDPHIPKVARDRRRLHRPPGILGAQAANQRLTSRTSRTPSHPKSCASVATSRRAAQTQNTATSMRSPDVGRMPAVPDAGASSAEAGSAGAIS